MSVLLGRRVMVVSSWRPQIGSSLVASRRVVVVSGRCPECLPSGGRRCIEKWP